MHRGKTEQGTKIFGANLNIFVIAARTVKFSGKVYYDIRTHIQAKILQNLEKKFPKFWGQI